jgi:DNA-directed RNA polymerase specialized sigma24 family protein
MAHTPPAHTPQETEHYWHDIRDHLEHALAKLPAKDREALLLRFYQQMTHAQLATTLAIPEDAARMRIARALEKLRQALGTGSSALLSTTLLAHATTSAPLATSASTVAMPDRASPSTA